MKNNIFLIIFFLFSNFAYSSFPIIQDPNEDTYKIVGYILGFFMLIFGVIIAYAYNNKTLIKYAWRGFMTVLLAFILITAIRFVLYFIGADDIPHGF
ncbi:MAG: hypothetical protein CMP73_02240 [Flavobacteriales bacterium]|nr:hypothetical protein [Flavobacteriales bacterium]|tara:strand:+ start:184 stop:474 length:291 start_codon:yes stop_codon:yes gene_type:complete